MTNGYAAIISMGGLDLYQTGEGAAVVVPGNWKPGNAMRGIVLMHGHGGSWLGSGGFTPNAAYTDLAKRGYFVIAPDGGGAATWGNANSTTALAAVVAYMRSVGVVGKIAFFGISMGSIVCLNYIRTAPSEAACYMGVTPVLNPADIQANDPINFGTHLGLSIDNNGYPPAYVDATMKATRNPSYYVTQGDLDDVPCTLWGALDDPIARWPFLESFDAAHPDCSIQSWGNGGHGAPLYSPLSGWGKAMLDFFDLHLT
jgi:pimeloyl-ACP methyl ester carboxylesterase